jgi:flagellar protein FliS
MRYPSASLAYRQASTQQASSVGLVIMLYDRLVVDLRDAIDAMGKGDIEERSRSLKHGFQVLQQLDGLLDMQKGGAAAQNLRRFYGLLRARMLEAQFKLSAVILERQIPLIVEVRDAWQQVDAPAHAPAFPEPTQIFERAAFSCTA